MSSVENKQVQELTAKIVQYTQFRNTISKSLSGSNRCSICHCNDDLNHIKDKCNKIYVCNTCIEVIKFHDLEKLHRNKKSFCEVCEEVDGVLFIRGITNNLCIDCFEKIKDL